MVFISSLPQQIRFKPTNSVTELPYKNFNRVGKFNTNVTIGIFSRNSISTETLEQPLHKLEKLIKSFKVLKYGWNGDSAKPIPEVVIENSQEILLAIQSELPEVYPTGRESIQFEYDKGEKSLEIEIFCDRFEIAFFDQADLLEEQSFILSDKNIINKYIAKLYEF